MSDMLVSVCVITYNHYNYIRQCLDGIIMQQTSFPFEIIINDDCSTDGTTEIIKEYVTKYPDIIRPIFHEENQYSKGVRGMFAKYCFPKARGKYIALCEGDDYLSDPLKLQKQYEILERDNTKSICFTKVKVVDRHGVSLNKTIPLQSVINKGTVTLKKYTREEFFHGRWTFHTSSFFLRKSIYDDMLNNEKDFIFSFPYLDLPLLLYFLYKANGYYLDEETSNYRWNSGGYNTSIINNMDLAISDELRLIQGLKEFNRLSKYRYFYNVLFRILRARRLIIRLQDAKGTLPICVKSILRIYRILRYKILGLKYTYN